jgi:hypothetical protein
MIAFALVAFSPLRAPAAAGLVRVVLVEPKGIRGF